MVRPGWAVRALALACGFALAACEADLKEGLYGCETGACPEGWICGSDMRCYSSPDLAPGGDGDGDGDTGDGDRDGSADEGSAASGGRDAGGAGSTGASGGSGGSGGSGSGGSDGGDSGGSGGTGGAGSGGSDAGEPVGATYAPCALDGSDCDATCLKGPDMMAATGVCTTACTSDDDCEAIDGKTAACIGQTCLPRCTSPGQCPGNLACYDAPVSMTEDEFVCFELVDPALDGSRGCMPGPTTTCRAPATCMFHGMVDDSAGVCSLRCNPMTECPGGGRCIEAFQGAFHCFQPCDVPADCQGGLECASFDGNGTVCIPPNWADGAPLDPPTMP